MGCEDEIKSTQHLKHLEGDVILDVQQPETPDDICHPSCLLTGLLTGGGEERTYSVTSRTHDIVKIIMH